MSTAATPAVNDNEWALLKKILLNTGYIVDNGGGGGGGSGNVVGPASAAANNIAIFNGTTGKIIKDSGVVAVQSVASSSGVGDAGKSPLLNGSGVLDPSFFTTIPANKGGTGLFSYVIGDMLYAATSSTIAALPAVAAGQVLVSAGTGTAPAYSADPVVTSITVSGVKVYGNIPQNSQSAAYTGVLADANKHIYHPSADTTARIWTIPANASVAYPIGTTLTFINDASGGVITIAITSDTLILAGTGNAGSRSLAANGIATAVKMTSTRWIINGTGLT